MTSSHNFAPYAALLLSCLSQLTSGAGPSYCRQPFVPENGHVIFAEPGPYPSGKRDEFSNSHMKLTVKGLVGACNLLTLDDALSACFELNLARKAAFAPCAWLSSESSLNTFQRRLWQAYRHLLALLSPQKASRTFFHPLYAPNVTPFLTPGHFF